MNEYIEMKWRRTGETVRVYGFSAVDIGRTYPEVRSYATIFSRSGKRQGGSGWQTVEVHELTHIEFWNEGDTYDRFEFEV